MVIADTTVWIDFLHGIPNAESLWLRANAGVITVGLTDLSLCEVLQGIRDDQEFHATQSYLGAFPVFQTGGAALAVAAAQNFRTLRARGFTVRKTIDCLIATFCIMNRHSLLHRDHDFDAFERHLGLQVVHP